jgi:hypothetical protein
MADVFWGNVGGSAPGRAWIGRPPGWGTWRMSWKGSGPGSTPYRENRRGVSCAIRFCGPHGGPGRGRASREPGAITTVGLSASGRVVPAAHLSLPVPGRTSRCALLPGRPPSRPSEIHGGRPLPAPGPPALLRAFFTSAPISFLCADDLRKSRCWCFLDRVILRFEGAGPGGGSMLFPVTIGDRGQRPGAAGRGREGSPVSLGCPSAAPEGWDAGRTLKVARGGAARTSSGSFRKRDSTWTVSFFPGGTRGGLLGLKNACYCYFLGGVIGATCGWRCRCDAYFTSRICAAPGYVISSPRFLLGLVIAGACEGAGAPGGHAHVAHAHLCTVLFLAGSARHISSTGMEYRLSLSIHREQSRGHARDVAKRGHEGGCGAGAAFHSVRYHRERHRPLISSSSSCAEGRRPRRNLSFSARPLGGAGPLPGREPVPASSYCEKTNIFLEECSNPFSGEILPTLRSARRSAYCHEEENAI